MNSYYCHIFHKNEKGNYIKNSNTYCFRGIQHYHKKEKPFNFVYLSNFKHKETEKYIPLIIKIVNKITPCKMVNDMIEVQLLETYDQSLIVLNFLRNLWWSPFIDGRATDYSIKFFEALKKSRWKDPLVKLTSANKIACTQTKYTYSAGHSNCHVGENLKIKNLEDLLNFKGTSTYTFLTDRN